MGWPKTELTGITRRIVKTFLALFEPQAKPEMRQRQVLLEEPGIPKPVIFNLRATLTHRFLSKLDTFDKVPARRAGQIHIAEKRKICRLFYNSRVDRKRTLRDGARESKDRDVVFTPINVQPSSDVPTIQWCS